MEEALKGYLDGGIIEPVAARLRKGGVAVLPTDTVYGLHCVVSSRSSIERIMRIKERRAGAGFILLVSSLGMAEALVSGWPGDSRSILASMWPAALTVILPASGDLPETLRPRGGVAVRMPAMPALLGLIERTGEPLVSTSVNRAGEKPLNSMREIKRAFGGLDAYISRRGAGRRVPSTIIDLAHGVPRLVRKGSGAKLAAGAFGIE